MAVFHEEAVVVERDVHPRCHPQHLVHDDFNLVESLAHAFELLHRDTVVEQVHQHCELYLQVVLLVHCLMSLAYHLVGLVPSVCADIYLSLCHVCLGYARVVFLPCGFFEHFHRLVEGIFIPAVEDV